MVEQHGYPNSLDFAKIHDCRRTVVTPLITGIPKPPQNQIRSRALGGV
jgi:hypothetical protein